MAEGELGVDWGDDDPGLDADVSLLEPESKRQKTGHIPAEAPRASEAKIEPGHAAAELPEAKLPDRVKEALNGVSSFEEYRRKRVFKYLHVYSGPEDVLGKAIKAEATKERRGCEVTSLDKLVNKDLDMTDVNQHRELCQEVRAGEYDGMHAGFPCCSFSVARWSKNPGPRQRAPWQRSMDSVRTRKSDSQRPTRARSVAYGSTGGIRSRQKSPVGCNFGESPR